jgi:glyoxylase-like metal-dependent hydrolase (beta-lactamase superfamily II)
MDGGEQMVTHEVSPLGNHATRVSRRRFVATLGLIGTATWLEPRWLFAQDGGIVESIRSAAANAEITVQHVRANISVLAGSGGNIAVLTGPDGKLLVDAGIPASRARISAALAGISSDPITHLINTHWHFDHTDGNEWVHSAGASITAHENTRRHLSEATRVEGWQHTFPPSPAGAIPGVVFSDELRLDLNRSSILLKHYANAHTDADISVLFADADVVHVGDTWWNGYFPFIDYSTGGSIDGTIQAAASNIAAVSSTTVVIPGHGPIGGKSEMVEFLDMLTAVRNKVAAIKNRGGTLDEVLAAKPTASYDAKWGGFAISGPAFTALVYAGV